MGMLLLEDHQPVVASSLIEQLPQLLTQHCQDLDCAIFFSTPKLAHLFSQGSNFLTTALSHIYQAGRHDVSRSCVVGIVDKLPGAWQIYHQKVNYSEGLVFMATSRQMVTTDDTKASESLPLVCFSSSQGLQNNGKPRSVRVIALPVANTLFVNGRHSTLFRQEWTSTTATTSQDIVSHPRDSQTLLRSVTIDTALNRRAAITMTTRIPLVSLTEPRTVKTVVGNIVREVEIEGKSEPASAELEKAVMKIVKDDSKEDTKVQIFAFLQKSGASHEKAFAQRQLLFWARLHKVTGGGGGWGQKRGLLSLDPNQVHPQEEEQSLNFVESLGGDSILSDRQNRTIAKAGEYIRFFQYRDPSHHDYNHQASFGRGKMSWRSDKAENSVIFDYLAGTIPPQDLPVSMPGTTTDDELHQGTPSVIPDHFGILSEGRLDVMQYDHETDLYSTSPGDSTSINVPNTLINFRRTRSLRKPQSQAIGTEEPKKKKLTDSNVSSRPAARRNRAQESSKVIHRGDYVIRAVSSKQVLPATTQSLSQRPIRLLDKDLSGPREIVFHHDVPAPGERTTYQDLTSPSIEASQAGFPPRVHVNHSSVAHLSEEGETGPHIRQQTSAAPHIGKRLLSNTDHPEERGISPWIRKYPSFYAHRSEEGESGPRIRREEREAPLRIRKHKAGTEFRPV